MTCRPFYEENSYKSTCNFTCPENFTLIGDKLLQCLSSGKWTGDTPICKAQKCETLRPPEKGTINCSHLFEDFGYNSICNFSCTEGFMLSGSEILQCTASGNWTAHPPTCKAQKCETLRPPEKGAVNCSHLFEDFGYNSICNFSCTEGFMLSGSEILQCTASGNWTAHPPTCKAKKCERLRPPEEGAINCSHLFEDFGYNSICNFSCTEGFMLSGSEILQCTASGNWTAHPPTCKAQKCETLRPPEKGAVNCSHLFEDFGYNSICNFSCTEGFMLSGSEILQCTASGNWTAHPPTCKAQKCETLRPPEKGAINCSHLFEDFGYNSICNFSCTEGFMLSGSEILQCTASGNWTAHPPTCKAPKCSHLLSPEKGFMYCSHLFEDLSYNSTCDFSCMEGFLLNGSERLRCTASGKWTSEAPTCKAINCNVITSPEMGAMTCSHPIGAFSYNSTCNFTCGEGFILRGPERLQCLASGMWSHQPPNCKAQICSQLQSPDKGLMSCSHLFEDFRYNTTCDFSCMEGFLLDGSEKLRCTASGKWTAETPTCKAKHMAFGQKFLIFLTGSTVITIAVISCLVCSMSLLKRLAKKKEDKTALNFRSYSGSDSEVFINAAYQGMA
ncbi:P-selectin-like [Protopterus annectens]|uniref:P-selectin-like n=1 Tax=Protopterus annectens TaxID=7888 RepID=UPI001CFAD1E2|nr:P-selectin-like [Protopterus annectens]